MTDAREQPLTREPRVLTWQGPQPLPQIPDTNFSVFMLKEMAAVAEARSGAIAVVDAETGQKRTYSELCDLVPRVSAGLAAAGVGLADRVMYYSPNHLDYPLWYLSIVHRGASIVLLSPVYEKVQEDLVHGIRMSGARFAVVHAELLDDAKAAFSLLPPDTLKKVWVIGGDAGASAVDDLAGHDPLPPVTQADGLDPATTVTQIPSSSGTTGPRKGVMISHRNEVARMMMAKHLAQHGLWFGQFEDYSTCLLMTSVSHAYACSFLFFTLMLGGTGVIMPRLSISAVVKKIKEHQVTLAVLTPHHLRLMAESSDLQQGDLRSLKVVACGGSSLTPPLIKAFKRRVDVQLYNVWGLTELAGPGTIQLVHSELKEFCLGKSLPFFDFKVVDVNSGQMLAEQQPGEIWVKSPTTLLGYVNDPSATAAFKDKDGWVHTGDYGYYDHQGFIYLTDRIKDLLKTMGNLQVQPSELEALLVQHPAVAEAAVVGVSGEDLEELPRAFVVLKPDAAVEPRVLQQFVDGQVQDHKKLSGGVWVLKDIPKNNIGKPFRRLLKDGKVVPLAVS